MRRGLTEWGIVTAVLVLAAAGLSLRAGDEIRGLFGVGPLAAASAPARRDPAPPAPAPALR